MTEFRLGKSDIAHFTDFEQLREACGLKPKKEKKLADKEKQLKKKFKCKACGEPLTYVTGNVMSCTNEKCRGIKVEKTNENGEKVISYKPSYVLLNNHWAGVAQKVNE